VLCWAADLCERGCAGHIRLWWVTVASYVRRWWCARVFLWALCRGDCRRAVVEVCEPWGRASEREEVTGLPIRLCGAGYGPGGRLYRRRAKKGWGSLQPEPVCAARGFHGVGRQVRESRFLGCRRAVSETRAAHFVERGLAHYPLLHTLLFLPIFLFIL